MTVEHRRASVAELHGLDPFAGGAPQRPHVMWCQPTDSAVVLGSRQTPELLDAERCRRAGLSIVRRRSGGGAVLIEPDAVAWADLVLPHGVAPDDVHGSMVWAGRLWRSALEATPATGASELEVHTGQMLCTAWSNLVCFAGIGPGEVVRAGRKLVGLSQRRTRHGIRIQGTVYHRAPSVDLTGLFATETPAMALPAPELLDLGSVAELMAGLSDALSAA